jgi:regulator of sigma E protease
MSVLAHAWSVAGYIVPFVFVLGIVIFFHELGHFLVGRLCGVKVDCFSIGFGPELYAFEDRYGTRWRVAALPLGGYVRFHGDAGVASTGPSEAAAATMPDQERAVSFFAQSVGKRAAIVAAGPIANLVLAIVILTGVYYVNGRNVLLPLVDSVAADSAAAAAGFAPGDLVVAIDHTPVESFEDMQRIVQASAEQPLGFEVIRDRKIVAIVATPRLRDLTTPFGTTRVGVLGIQARSTPEAWHVERYGLARSAQLAVAETWFVVTRTGAYLGGLLIGRESTDQLSGPIRIAEMSGEMAKIGFAALMNLAAILSISVGILNLLPVPLLDGGHLFFYAIEAVQGRALTERTQQLGFRLGLTLVAALMILATFNDLLWLTKQLMQWG